MSRRAVFAQLGVYVALLVLLGYLTFNHEHRQPFNPQYQSCASSVHKAPGQPPSTPIMTCIVSIP
jgi:hypothetical protein